MKFYYLKFFVNNYCMTIEMLFLTNELNKNTIEINQSELNYNIEKVDIELENNFSQLT